MKVYDMNRKDRVAAGMAAIAHLAAHPALAAMDHLEAVKASIEPLPTPNHNEKDA